MKKRIASVILSLMLLVAFMAGCSSSQSSSTDTTAASADASSTTTAASTEEKKVIKIGIRADGVDMLEAIKDSVAAAGYELEVTTFDDSIQPNVALAEGSIDVNWFQHQPYLDSYNKENGTDFVMLQPYTHYPLFAMYSSKWSSVEEIPDGATIGICNDSSNQARGLRMLEELGLITLDSSVETPTKYDIVDNPKNLEFIEAEMSVLPQSLQDVDAICLAAMHMYNAGLDAKSYIAESSDSKDYMLGFTVRKEDADAQWAADLVNAACCDKLKEYFEEVGTLIPAF
jgi:D-methionine transport system substrate-binding protein